MKKVLILGSEGYIGRALHKYLKERNCDVFGIDNNLRNENVKSIGSKSIVEIDETLHEKKFIKMDISKNYLGLKTLMFDFKPDVIVHLAEQPSAPFSMMNQVHASETMRNNMQGTMNVIYAMKEICPKAHLIKLGTEGEYSSDIWDGKHIPEGSRMEVFTGKKDKHNNACLERWEIPTPRYFGSWYHFTKFSESYMLDYANRIWGLTITDINQGIVYSHRNGTRLDADYFFGTIIHRFVAQAITGVPLTVYGTGGQVRGFICLQNSLEAIELLINNPAKDGEFRVIHQTTESLNINDIAKKIQEKTGCEISYIDNPRVEKESNTFTFDTTTLDNLGLKPIKFEDELPNLIKVFEENKDNIVVTALMPKDHAKWN